MNAYKHWILTLCLLGCADCRPPSAAVPGSAPATAHDEHDHDHIAIPDTVRRNLGITFAKVESRAVAQTIRVPGRFEVPPQARRDYHATVSGRVELMVKQFDRVAAGDVLYRLASPEWRELQQRLNESMSGIRQAEARVASIPSLLAAHKHHEALLAESVSLWEERAKQVQSGPASGAVSIDERTTILNTLATKRAELAEVLEREADLEAQGVSAQAEHDAAHARFSLLLSSAAQLTGITEPALASPYTVDGHLQSTPNSDVRIDQPMTQPLPKWRTIAEIEVRATMTGIVDVVSVSSGGWAAISAKVVGTVDTSQLRFRAQGLQSDLGRLHDGLPANIVPPRGGPVGLGSAMPATVVIGLEARPDTRSIDLIATPKTLAGWARPGVSAQLEVITAGGDLQLAIPLACVIQDGLARVFFLRERDHPDEVIRLEAELGIDDGQWVVVKSGVREGDEVVQDGVYQLMNATSGTAQKGGHFHADGTFHEDHDEKDE